MSRDLICQLYLYKLDMQIVNVWAAGLRAAVCARLHSPDTVSSVSLIRSHSEKLWINAIRVGQQGQAECQQFTCWAHLAMWEKLSLISHKHTWPEVFLRVVEGLLMVCSIIQVFYIFVHVYRQLSIWVRHLWGPAEPTLQHVFLIVLSGVLLLQSFTFAREVGSIAA